MKKNFISLSCTFNHYLSFFYILFIYLFIFIILLIYFLNNNVIHFIPGHLHHRGDLQQAASDLAHDLRGGFLTHHLVGAVQLVPQGGHALHL